MSLKKALTIVLQLMIVLIGVAAIAFLLWEPTVEGRNAHATLFEVYFKDPFLAFAYVGSIAFFVGLHRAFRVLGFARQDAESSPQSLAALRTVKHCALTLIGFVFVGEIFIWMNTSDDRAGGVFMGLLVTVASTTVAIIATRFERTFRQASRG